jgi:hypothetical protein
LSLASLSCSGSGVCRALRPPALVTKAGFMQRPSLGQQEPRRPPRWPTAKAGRGVRAEYLGRRSGFHRGLAAGYRQSQARIVVTLRDCDGNSEISANGKIYFLRSANFEVLV